METMSQRQAAPLICPPPNQHQPNSEIQQAKGQDVRPEKAYKSTPRMRAACDTCRVAKVRCDQAKPVCSHCASHGKNCVYSRSTRSGRPGKVRSRQSGGSGIKETWPKELECLETPVTEHCQYGSFPRLASPVTTTLPQSTSTALLEQDLHPVLGQHLDSALPEYVVHGRTLSDSLAECPSEFGMEDTDYVPHYPPLTTHDLDHTGLTVSMSHLRSPDPVMNPSDLESTSPMSVNSSDRGNVDLKSSAQSWEGNATYPTSSIACNTPPAYSVTLQAPQVVNIYYNSDPNLSDALDQDSALGLKLMNTLKRLEDLVQRFDSRERAEVGGNVDLHGLLTLSSHANKAAVQW